MPCVCLPSYKNLGCKSVCRLLLSVVYTHHCHSVVYTHHSPSLARKLIQGDCSQDNVKFPDISRHSSAALNMLSATHIMPVLVLSTYAAYNEQFLATFPWQDFFLNISLTFSKIPDICLTAVKFPDISRFSRQVVTLLILVLPSRTVDNIQSLVTYTISSLELKIHMQCFSKISNIYVTKQYLHNVNTSFPAIHHSNTN